MKPSTIVTRVLVGLNLLGFLWEIVVTHGGVLSIMGGGNIDAVTAAAINPIYVLQGHQWYRIVTGAFVHAGIFHIFVNMISLWSLGRFMEWILGPVKIFALYILTMLASSLAIVYLSPPDTWSLGASGAIFGLFGALFAVGLRLGKPGMDIVKSNIGILALNLIITFTPSFGISWQAHIGGLVSGFVLGFILFTPPKRVQADVVDTTTGQALETEYESPSH